MDLQRLRQRNEFEWELPQSGAMRVPGVIFASRELVEAMSRHEATKRWHGRALIDELAARGILIRSPNWRGVAEEAPLVCVKG